MKTFYYNLIGLYQVHSTDIKKDAPHIKIEDYENDGAFWGGDKEEEKKHEHTNNKSPSHQDHQDENERNQSKHTHSVMNADKTSILNLESKKPQENEYHERGSEMTDKKQSDSWKPMNK